MLKINDKFFPTSLAKLTKIVLQQLREKKEVLGLPEELFFRPQENDFFKTSFYGQQIDSPLGVAAGPHTQLAQNIVVSWLAGARFIELKTVQTLDELDVSKPCIDMQDEGYNCEWSQELKIHRSFDQYVDAWILIHILQKELGLPQLGTIFNMSVGYDLKGIMQENVQWFFDKMEDASDEIFIKKAQLGDIYPGISDIDIPTRLTDNITLSTMHGCPPDEVEQIATYLIKERKLNTTIKLNPTLLGEELREILRNNGYKTEVPDEAFEHDLKYNDAVGIISRLKKLAEEEGVFFGIKLTNTLESRNNKGVFDDEMMYMSGRALHPISINLARKLQNEFDGQLNVSFSGGVDAFNIADVLACGLRPVTMSSDLLKPGGYGRLAQYYENLRKAQEQFKATDIDSYINAKANTGSDDVRKNALENLNRYADKVLIDPAYKKNAFVDPSIKTPRKLGQFDCIAAPCKTTCPTNQDVPQYMYFTQKGDKDKAFLSVLEDNPFPTVLGYTCDHTCQLKCTRINYDETLQIREIKRYIAEKNLDKDFELPVKKVDKTAPVAIIGGGPAGISAAFYLKTYGFDDVTVYEATDTLGGMVARAIPLFRLQDEQIQKDIDRILKLGVKVKLNEKIDAAKFEQLRKENKYIFVCAGAQKAYTLTIEGADAKGVYNSLNFFYETRRNPKLDIGKNVVVIGGGNTAMDAVRIAKRLVPEDGKVYLTYRRTKQYMPAHYHELIDAMKEGVEILELTNPVKIETENGKVKGIWLQKMRFEGEDKSGRPRPVPVEGEVFFVEADTVVPAIGQDLDMDFIDPEDVVTEIPLTKEENIFIGGDAARGGFSIVAAIADGKKAAYEIIARENPGFNPWTYKEEKQVTYRELKLKRYRREFPEPAPELPLDNRNSFDIVVKTMNDEQAKEEADRCLLCDELCDICTTVCPNLANQHYEIEPFKKEIPVYRIVNGEAQQTATEIFEIKQRYQTLNIADWCNECGNCSTFCPTAGRPYVDKPKIHLSWQSFSESPNGYYLQRTDELETMYYKDNSKLFKLRFLEDKLNYASGEFEVELDKNKMEIIKLVEGKDGEISLIPLQKMLLFKEIIEQIKLS